MKNGYRKPKYFYFDEKGKFVFDAFFSSEYEDEVSGDRGDRVTGETDSEKISSSTVNRDDQVTETDGKAQMSVKKMQQRIHSKLIQVTVRMTR